MQRVVCFQDGNGDRERIFAPVLFGIWVAGRRDMSMPGTQQ